MATTLTTLNRGADVLNTRIVPDRRRYRRVPLTLLGRFMRANKEEFPCKLIDVSVGGISVMAPADVDDGERIIAYFDQLGGLEGHVVRPFEGGFALALTATSHKREKLAAQLTWLLNRHELDPADERRHDRIKPNDGSSSLALAGGIVIQCQVMDVSISGASVGTTARPDIGSTVVLGKLRARVVRHHDQGIGVQFIDTDAANLVRQRFGA
ncbi:MAG: PilZ domain-containing protein [Pseudomonadota bacterium]